MPDVADILLEQPAPQVGPGHREGTVTQGGLGLGQEGAGGINDQPAGAIEGVEALRGPLPAVEARQVAEGQAVTERDVVGQVDAQLVKGPFDDQQAMGQGQLQQGLRPLRVVDPRHPFQGLVAQAPEAFIQGPVLRFEGRGQGLKGLPGGLVAGGPVRVGFDVRPAGAGRVGAARSGAPDPGRCIPATRPAT